MNKRRSRWLKRMLGPAPWPKVRRLWRAMVRAHGTRKAVKLMEEQLR